MVGVVDKEVDTFTGDELNFEVVDASMTEDGGEVEKRVEVVKEEEADFEADAEVVNNTDVEPAPLSPSKQPELQPRKDLMKVATNDNSESDLPTTTPIPKVPRANSALKHRSKSRSNRARVVEPKPAPKRAPSRPARGRSGAPPERVPIRPLSPAPSRKGPRAVMDAELTITPSLSSKISKTAFLRETLECNDLTGWSLINMHVAAYYYEQTWKYSLTHPRQLAAAAVRRDAHLTNRWLCWACQHPNKMEPQKTGKTAFKSSMEVSYHWWQAHASVDQWNWYAMAIHHEVTLEDILKLYGINVEEQPWPVGTALQELPIFIPSRSTPHDRRLFGAPFWRKECDRNCASEQGLPWNTSTVAVYSGNHHSRTPMPPSYPPPWVEHEHNRPSKSSAQSPSSAPSVSPKLLERQKLNKERCQMALDRGLKLFPGAEDCDFADVTTLGWLDPLDCFYKPLIKEVEELCAGATSLPDYGESRKQWHRLNFGESVLTLEFLRLEEHGFYLVVYKMAATRAAISPEIFSPKLRELALLGTEWGTKCLDDLLRSFMEAEKATRPLSHNAYYKDCVHYILECCHASVPVYPQNAPRAPGREGKLTKSQQAELLL